MIVSIPEYCSYWSRSPPGTQPYAVRTWVWWMVWSLSPWGERRTSLSLVGCGEQCAAEYLNTRIKNTVQTTNEYSSTWRKQMSNKFQVKLLDGSNSNIKSYFIPLCFKMLLQLSNMEKMLRRSPSSKIMGTRPSPQNKFISHSWIT